MLTLKEAKDWIGLTDDDSDDIIIDLIQAADEDLRAKVGGYNDNSAKAKLYMKYFVMVNFSDRLGEMSNKESSAVSNLMRNIIFSLRLEWGENANNNV